MMCQYGFLEKEMTIHSSIAWRIPIDRAAWQATVHGVTRVGHDLATKPPAPEAKKIYCLDLKSVVSSIPCLSVKKNGR